MKRLYAAYTFVACLIFALSMFAAAFLGTTRPAHPGLAGLTLCDDEPCWHDLAVGESRSDDVYRVLEEQGYTLIDNYMFSPDLLAARAEACTFRVHITLGGGINLLNLSECPHVYLGDIMALFDTPDDLLFCGTRVSMYYNLGYSIDLHVKEDGKFSMYSEVEEMTFYSIRREDRWHGFAPLWRYHQLEQQAAAYIYSCN